MLPFLRSTQQLANRGAAVEVPLLLRALATQADAFLSTIPRNTPSSVLNQPQTGNMQSPVQMTPLSSMLGFHALLPETAQALAQLAVAQPEPIGLPDFCPDIEIMGKLDILRCY